MAPFLPPQMHDAKQRQFLQKIPTPQQRYFIENIAEIFYFFHRNAQFVYVHLKIEKNCSRNKEVGNE